MIVSDPNRYLFVHLPHTGGTAIAAELCAHYGGRSILFKHANHIEFLRIARPEQRGYFVFSVIRNPLDEAVSRYLRFKSNHNRMFTEPRLWARNGGHVSERDLRTYHWLVDTGADFPTFFRRYFRLTYDNWSCLSHHRFDYLIRFETLAAGFAEVLKRIGLPCKRLLPALNETAAKPGNFLDAYPLDLVPHAKRIFGPFMRKWGYAFPPAWGDAPASVPDDLAFAGLGVLRRLYWGGRSKLHPVGRRFIAAAARAEARYPRDTP